MPPVPPPPDPRLAAERWACAVRLMDSLVHDVRNPLNALAINVEILQEKLARAAGGEVPAAQAKNLVAMREQVARVNALLGEFARFLAPTPAAPTTVALDDVLRQAAAVLGHAARRARVRLDVEAGGPAPVQATEPGTLQFVVLRSLLRAIERTPEGGTVAAQVCWEDAAPVLQLHDGSGQDVPETVDSEDVLKAASAGQGVEVTFRGPIARLAFRPAPEALEGQRAHP